MLTRVLLRTSLLLVAFTSPALLLAQFQPPNPDELKMTSDPKAPGAAAVYLEINEDANDPIHYESYYARIKVLTEKGKELATVSLPYRNKMFKIDAIQGRTIHADGTILPLTVKPEDLLISKVGESQINKKVFTLPSAEVGSILEYKYILRYDDNNYSSPWWDVQLPFFVHKAHYQFTPFKAFLPGTQNETSSYLTDENGDTVNTLIWWGRLPAGTTVTQVPASGRYTLDVTDVPPEPDEQFMPPIENMLYVVRFYYKSSSTASQFWVDAGKRWVKQVDHFAEPSGAIRAAAAGIVAPTDAPLDKAKKLYAAVQALDNTDYSRKKSESEMKQLNIKSAKTAEDTWKQKSGDSEDIAMLYLALLRGAGLTAYATKVTDRSQRLLDLTYLNIYQLDDTLVLLTIDGKQAILDPGEKMCPFGTVNWRHSSASGLAESAQGLSVATTPDQNYAANTINRIGTVTLDSHGTATGQFNFLMGGQEALRWRQYALRNDLDEVKKSFDKELEGLVPDGIEAHVDHFLGLDTPDTNLMAIVKITGNLGTATARRVMLPGLFFETRDTPFVKEEKRQTPVDMHYGNVEIDQVSYVLPEGMAVEGAPTDATISWEGHAVYVVKTKTDPGQVVITRTLARGFSNVKAADFQDLRGFYTKVAAADQAELVLTNAPATAPASAPATAPALIDVVPAGPKGN